MQQIHESNPVPNKPNEYNVIGTQTQNSNDDSDLPIAIRKKPREYTKDRYILSSHYVLLKKLSSNYKQFISSLNTISVPNILS